MKRQVIITHTRVKKKEMIAKFGMKAKEQSVLNILILLSKKELKRNGEHEGSAQRSQGIWTWNFLL